MRRLALISALLAAPAPAQVVYPPATLDTSQVASKADVQAAADKAAAAQAAAAAACVATPSIPPTEMPGGAAGTNTGQCRPVNAVQPRITRVRPFNTVTGGTSPITYQDIGTTDLGVIVTVNIPTNPLTPIPTCGPLAGSITATGLTVKCTVPIVNLGIIGISAAPAGTTGSVTVLPNTPAS
jgi:hypothetical protein